MQQSDPMEPDMVSMSVQQGVVGVEYAHAVHRSEKVVCIYVDFSTKYPILFASSSGGGDGACLMMGVQEDTLHKVPGKPDDELTVITFPEFVGWSVFACNVSRYTAAVCLLKG